MDFLNAYLLCEVVSMKGTELRERPEFIGYLNFFPLLLQCYENQL